MPGILILQNSKRELANAALSGQTGKGVMKLTMDDIMSMFLIFLVRSDTNIETIELFKRSSGRDEQDDEESDED